jgi:hypothetical protein
MLKTIARRFSQQARTRRGQLFIEYLQPTEQDRILDLGGADGTHFASILPFRKNVTIADINEPQLLQGAARYGFHPIVLDETGQLPFPDNYFDIVFCSSVIEHVTAPKEQLRAYRTNSAFFEAAFARQQAFAKEIRRVGQRYFVQTPHKYFLIESHSWMPAPIVFLPRSWQIWLVDFLRGWWPKSTEPDWNLLTPKLMQLLFPDDKKID